jgi:glycosyltransferase involved in cell wall biosynthesis
MSAKYQSADSEKVLLVSNLTSVDEPFITVAIPHYKQLPYLKLVLDSIFEQEFTDFELLVSNDHSPDNSDEVIPILLQEAGCRFSYYSQPHNLGYDGNVRFCLSAARGRYVFLLGNDDTLTNAQTLQQVADVLQQLNYPEVAFTNFGHWGNHQIVQRATATRILGQGIETAIRFFRSFSFVSGLIFDRQAAMQHESNQWDKSVYYQVYLACRIIASGGRLAALDIVAVDKDVTINGETVPNYMTKAAKFSWSFEKRHTGVDSVIRVACAAIAPLAETRRQSAIQRQVISQALMILHPYWVLEYRRIANWSAGVGIARGHYPGHLLAEYDLSWFDRLYLWGLYLLLTPVALFFPISVFNRIKSGLSQLVRRIQQS